MQWRPTWIYTCDPLAIPAVWLLRKLSRCKFAYHEHDAPQIDRINSRFMGAVLTFRQKLARQIELCIVPQQERLAEFIRTTGRKRLTLRVWNCPRLKDIQPERPAVGVGQKLTVFYQGSINRERLPLALFDAASRFKGKVRLLIAGYEAPGSVGYMDMMAKFVADQGAPGIVNFVGASTSREALLKMAATADVALSLMPHDAVDVNLRNMVGASNKTFDAMACGLPLLVSDLPEWQSTFVEPGYGRVCNPANAASIQNTLAWYLDHPEERRHMGRKCAEKIRADWNYECTFAEVVKVLET